MVKKTPQKRVLFTRGSKLLALGLIGIVSILGVIVGPHRQATAVTSSTINFQARLMTASGTIVPDGNYNVDFKIYNALTSSGSSSTSCSGDTACLWSETRTSGNQVHVVNGYLTANLGSVTALPSIDWSQSLWLTMNIGGTGGSPVWDGEMSPRLTLTAVPYAFSAGQLTTNTGTFSSTLNFTTPTANRTISLPDASGTVCLQSSASCGFALSSGSGSYIQNGVATQAANFNVQASSSGSVAAILQANAAGAGDILDLKNGAGTPVATFSSTGAVLLKNSANTTTAFQIQGSTGAVLLNADTSNSRIGINTSAPTEALDVVGNIQIKDASTPTKEYRLRTSGSALDFEASGADLYLSVWSGAGYTGTQYNQFIFSSSGSNINAQRGINITGLSGQDILHLNANGGGTTDVVNSNGDLTLQGIAGSYNAFRINNTSSVKLFGVDTNNGYATLGNASTTAGQNAAGKLLFADGTLDGFNATVASNTLTTNRTISLPDATGTVCLQSSASCGFALGSASSYIQNGVSTQAANFNVQAASSGTVAATLQANAAGTGDILDLRNGSGAIVGSVSSVGALLFQNSTDSTAALTVKNAAGTSTVLNVDTTNGRVGVGGVALASKFEVIGGDAAIYNNGGNPRLILGDTTSDYGYLQWDSTNNYFRIETVGTNGLKINDNNVSIGNIYPGQPLTVAEGTTQLFQITSTGTVLSQTSTNSTTAFQVQNSSSAAVLDVDTSNSRVGIGTNAPSRTADIAINNATTSALPLLVEQAGTGDTGLELKSATQSYYVGSDSSDGNFKISSNTATGTSTVMGYNTIGSSTDTNDQNSMNATKFTSSATGTLTQLNSYIATVDTTPNNKAQMAIYTDSSGSPGTLLASSSSITLTANSWNAFTIPATAITNGVTYWLVYNTNSSSNSKNNFKFLAAGGTNQSKYVAQTFGTWPSSWSGGTFDNAQASFYGPVVSLVPANDFSTNLFSLGNTGVATFQNSTDTTSAFRIQNTAGTSNLFIADTTDSRIAIGQATATYTLDVAGDINTTTQLRIGGVVMCTSSGCTPNSTSTSFIHNQATLQSANFFVQAATSGSVAGVLQANAAGTGDILDLKNGSGVNVATVGSAGTIAIQNSTDNISSFTIATSIGGTNENVLRVDTISERVAIGVIAGTPSSKLNIATASTVGLRVFESGAFDTLELANATSNILTVTQTGTMLQQTTTNSANAFQIQNQSGIQVLNVSTSGGILTIGNVTTTSGQSQVGKIILADGTIDGFGMTLATATMTASRTITLPDATGTVCLQSATTCGFIQLQATTPGTVQTGNLNITGTGIFGTALQVGGNISLTATSSTTISASTSAAAGYNMTFQASNAGGTNNNGGSIVLTGGTSTGTGTPGSVTVKPQTDGNAFLIQNAGGSTIFDYDTSQARLTMYAGNITIAGVAIPNTMTLTSSGTGGTLAAHTYLYDLAAQGADGSNTAAAGTSPGSVTTSGTTSKNTLTWTAVPNASGYVLFRSIDGGATWLESPVIPAGTTTLVDTGSVSWAAGSNPSNINSAGGLYLQNGTAVTFDGTSNQNALAFFNNNALTMGNYNLNGVVSMEASTFMERDTTNFHTNLNIDLNGEAAFSPVTNSAVAFQVQKADNTTVLFNVDTSAEKITIGPSAGDATGTLLILGNKTGSATDPTGVAGAMYYNVTSGRFRCYENAVWYNCLTHHIVTLGSDVTNNNVTANTIADVTGLSFAVSSGTTYHFHALIDYTAAATTTGSRWSINGPTTSLLGYTSTWGVGTTSQTVNYANAYNLPASSNASSPFTAGDTAIIEGMITPSAGGTVIVRFASGVTSSAIVAKAGSTIEWW
ncbi:MAG: beta strand repeat-containing protein [Candidatus Saccharibacteria bacterium]